MHDLLTNISSSSVQLETQLPDDNLKGLSLSHSQLMKEIFNRNIKI